MESEAGDWRLRAGNLIADLGVKIGQDKLVLPMVGVDFIEILHWGEDVLVFWKQHIHF